MPLSYDVIEQNHHDNHYQHQHSVAVFTAFLSLELEARSQWF
jgi:hypothetical protein